MSKRVLLPAWAVEHYTIIIKHIARRWYKPNHPTLSYEDLIAEGLLVLCRCWQQIADQEKQKPVEQRRTPHDILQLSFAHCVRNHFMDLTRRARAQARDYRKESSVEDIAVLLPDRRDITIKQTEQYWWIDAHLSLQAKQVAAELLCPSPKCWNGLVKDVVRARHLKRNGDRHNASSRLQPKPQHIAKALGMTNGEVRAAYREIATCLDSMHS